MTPGDTVLDQLSYSGNEPKTVEDENKKGYWSEALPQARK